MKKNNQRQFTFQCISLICGLVLCMSLPSAASAHGCYGPICGKVNNRSKWIMYTTVDLGYGVDLCDVWNWNGGKSRVWKQAHCHQVAVGPEGHRGGGGVDVDAFTFNDRNYTVKIGGKWFPQTKGVWTKIETDERAVCDTNLYFNYPVCFVQNVSLPY